MDLINFKIIRHPGKKGFTLIETLVGVSIFTIIVALSVEFFATSLETQQKVLLTQRLLDNVSYAFEYMSRSLRMAQKGDGVCNPGSFDSFGPSQRGATGADGIRFVNYEGICQEFYWKKIGDVNVLRVWKDIGPSGDQELTPVFLDIVKFKITGSGWTNGDTLQPRITIFMEAKSVKKKNPELQPSIRMQTTISQRNIDE